MNTMNDDGFNNDQQRSLEGFRLDSGSKCRGESCCGWHLSNLDTWVACSGCNPSGNLKEHPEMDYDM